MSGQPDLFDAAPDLPEGFRYRPALIDEAAERGLAEKLGRLPFKAFEFHGFLGRRRIVSFGWRYVFDGSGLEPAELIPDFLLPLREQAAAFAGIDPAALEHVLLTEYEPGAAIGWHRDRSVFGDVVGISLLAPARLRFRRKQGPKWQRAVALAADVADHLEDDREADDDADSHRQRQLGLFAQRLGMLRRNLNIAAPNFEIEDRSRTRLELRLRLGDTGPCLFDIQRRRGSEGGPDHLALRQGGLEPVGRERRGELRPVEAAIGPHRARGDRSDARYVEHDLGVALDARLRFEQQPALRQIVQDHRCPIGGFAFGFQEQAITTGGSIVCDQDRCEVETWHVRSRVTQTHR